MTALNELHHRLALLRRRSFLRRLVCGIAPLVSSCLCVLAGVFWLDFAFRLDAVQRAVAAICGLLLFGWSWKRLAWPFLRVRQTEIDAARFVERQHGLQDELVAALQFESPDPARHASRQLECAVIDQGRSLTEALDVFRGFEYRPLFRRAGVSLLALAAWTLAAVMIPDHVSSFFQRLAWQSARYPTATVVQTLIINDQQALSFEQHGSVPQTVTCAEGAAVDFVVESSGRAAAEGTVRLVTADGQRARRIKLTAGENSLTALNGARQRYRARLWRLVESLRYQVFLGDTWTDPAEIRMIPRPIIQLSARVERPRYTSLAAENQDQGQSPTRSHLQLDVPAGSDVQLEVVSINGKALREVRLTLTSPGDGTSYLFSSRDQDLIRWSLPAADTVFASVQAEIQFELQVTDRDGLGLDQPLSGVVSVQPDHVPVAAIDSAHRLVLPQAEPSLEYQIADDFGLSSAVLHAQITRAKEASSDAQQPAAAETYRLEIPLRNTPIPADRLPLVGSYALRLAGWSLHKGDQVTLTLEAIDNRGVRRGKSSFSEPLRLQVSDEHGVISAISGLDEQTEQQLSEVIQRQLEVAR